MVDTNNTLQSNSNQPWLVQFEATSTGRVVDYYDFLEGNLTDASRLKKFFMTTTLPDVFTDIHEFCQNIDPSLQILIDSPNSFVTTKLTASLAGNSFLIHCGRKWIRSRWFPFGAEFGRNYDLLVYAESSDSDFLFELKRQLQSRYNSTEYSVTTGATVSSSTPSRKSDSELDWLS